jgi:DNA-dependent RNA polymerase auxiliary subunit epsilon
MAETFMTQHSVLRKKNQLRNKNENKSEDKKNLKNHEMFYNFDNINFIKQLNGVTKLMVALGTIESPYNNKNYQKNTKLNYIYMPVNIIKEKNSKTFNEKKNFEININFVYGDTFMLDNISVMSKQVELLHPLINDTNKLFINAKFESRVRRNLKNNNDSIKNMSKIDSKIEKISSVVPISSASTSNPVCVKYLGSIGGIWPTPQVEFVYVYMGMFTIVDIYMKMYLCIYVYIYICI